MATITTTTEIERPAQTVFAYATDPSRFAECQRGVVSGSMDTSAAPKVGDRCQTTRRIGFAERPVTSEIVHIDPPTTWGVRGIDGPIRAAVDVTVEALAPNRSRLTISLEFRGHGAGRLLVPLVVERSARKEMPGNVATLKRLIEANDRA